MKKTIIIIYFLGAVLLAACQQQAAQDTQLDTALTDAQDTLKPLNKATEIIQKAIDTHGGEAYKTLRISFEFREKQYRLSHQEGLFQYERIFKEDSSQAAIHDLLNNEGFTRKVNEKVTVLDTEKSKAYQNSVNSVMYFTLLPYGLMAPSVKHQYLGTDTLKNKVYHQIQVTFRQDGGGEDYQDVYVYWFNAQDFTLDFLAYSYEVNGGGIRFREAFNRQKIAGVVFQDYHNYKVPLNTPMQSIGDLWEKNQLEKLSEIENKNIKALPPKS